MAAPTGPVVPDDGRPNGPEHEGGVGAPVTPAPAASAEPLAPNPAAAAPPAQDPAFQQWLAGGGQPIAPAAPPSPYAQPQTYQPPAAQPQAAPQLPADLDADTLAWLTHREEQNRQDFSRAMQMQRAEDDELRARTEMWSTFQSRYPEFAGEDAIVGQAYREVMGGRTDLPPTAAMRDQLFDAVYHRAVANRDRLIQRAGYEFADDEGDEEVNRTAGVGGGTGGAAPETPSAPEDAEDTSSLLTDLVKMQGKTEFYPESPPEVLALYGKSNLRR